MENDKWKMITRSSLNERKRMRRGLRGLVFSAAGSFSIFHFPFLIWTQPSDKWKMENDNEKFFERAEEDEAVIARLGI
jgi:hypothetical protein